MERIAEIGLQLKYLKYIENFWLGQSKKSWPENQDFNNSQVERFRVQRSRLKNPQTAHINRILSSSNIGLTTDLRCGDWIGDRFNP
jgi:hypothetical protein